MNDEYISETDSLDKAIQTREVIIDQQKEDLERVYKLLAVELGTRKELESNIESLKATIEQLQSQIDTGFQYKGKDIKYV